MKSSYTKLCFLGCLVTLFDSINNKKRRNIPSAMMTFSQLKDIIKFLFP